MLCCASAAGPCFEDKCHSDCMQSQDSGASCASSRIWKHRKRLRILLMLTSGPAPGLGICPQARQDPLTPCYQSPIANLVDPMASFLTLKGGCILKAVARQEKGAKAQTKASISEQMPLKSLKGCCCMQDRHKSSNTGLVRQACRECQADHESTKCTAWLPSPHKL